jgi:hypothetical protein
MAKKSMIAREKKRTQIVKKSNAKRDALKAIIKNPNSTMEAIEGTPVRPVSIIAAGSPGDRMVTIGSSVCVVTNCVKRPCGEIFLDLSRQVGRIRGFSPE